MAWLVIEVHSNISLLSQAMLDYSRFILLIGIKAESPVFVVKYHLRGDALHTNTVDTQVVRLALSGMRSKWLLFCDFLVKIADYFLFMQWDYRNRIVILNIHTPVPGISSAVVCSPVLIGSLLWPMCDTLQLVQMRFDGWFMAEWLAR